MKKSDRMEIRIRQLAGEQPLPESGDWPAAYAGYFVCFNRCEYYEAHDVLEHLWLQTDGPERPYFKGLIQFAGGFVHLRKQYLRPHHHKDGRRLGPAARLFRLALENWAALPDEFWGLPLDLPRSLCLSHIEHIEKTSRRGNPWRPETAPQLFPTQPGRI